MAHDFTNVLQAVMAVVALLQRHPGDPECVLRQAAMPEASIARGSAVTTWLLADDRTTDAVNEPVDPDLLMTHLRDSLQPTMPGVTISLDVAPGCRKFQPIAANWK